MSDVASKVARREIAGWAMFDFANSAYTTVVITVVYSAFFVAHIVPAESTARDSYWAAAMVVSSLVTLLLAPLAGAVCDFGGHRKRWLLAASLLCAFATMGLAFVGPGQVWLGLTLIVLATVGFNLSETFCGSFLPELAAGRSMARISAIGWGIGYFGGLASLIVVLMGVIRADEATDYASWLLQNRIAMVVTGVFFLIAALPTFLLVRERAAPRPGFAGASMTKLFSAGIATLRSGAETARMYPNLFRFFAAFVVYMAGLQAVIKFIGIYAREEVRLTSGEMIPLFLILQLSAAAGAVAFGWLEGLLGPRKTVILTLLWWVAATLAIFFVDVIAAALGQSPKTVFFVLAVIAGSGLGSLQSSSRAVVGILSPRSRSGEVFGLWGVCIHLANILGMTFGFASDLLSSRRDAMLLIVLFFAVGAVLMRRVTIVSPDASTGGGNAEVNAS